MAFQVCNDLGIATSLHADGIKTLSNAVLRFSVYDLLRCKTYFSLEILSFWEQIWREAETEDPTEEYAEDDSPRCASCGKQISQDDRRRRRKLIRHIDRGYRFSDLKSARYPYDFIRQCEALRGTHLSQEDILRFMRSEGHSGRHSQVRFSDQEKAVRELSEHTGSVAAYIMAIAKRKKDLRTHPRGRPENVLAILVYRISHAM